MFLKNVWYAAGLSHEINQGELQAIRIAGEPIVLYRRSGGDVVALVDRCPHRWAPLSKGRLEGDTLRCMYHGIRFDGDGRCVEVPDQAATPAALAVRTFPVVERHRFVWIWLGDRQADPSRIPDLGFLDDEAERQHRFARIDYAAHHLGICDNLLDLSHVAFLHENTLAGGATQTDFKSHTAEIENGVRVHYWKKGDAAGSASRRPDGNPTDVFNVYDFTLPGIFRLRSRAYPAGTANTLSDAPPPDDLPALLDDVSGQAVTPMTERSTRYFFSFGSRRDAGEGRLAGIWSTVGRAFEEDREMIEAQQRIIDEFPGERMVGIAADRGVTLFRRIMQRALDREAAGHGAGA